MLISKTYAQKLIRDGKAVEIGTTTEREGICDVAYWIINRIDIQRVDHVRHNVMGETHLAPLTRLGRHPNA